MPELKSFIDEKTDEQTSAGDNNERGIAKSDHAKSRSGLSHNYEPSLY